MRSAKICFLVLCCALLSSPVAAAELTTTLLVTATVLSACQVKTTPLEFGIYDPSGANADTPLDAVGGVTLFCSAGTAARIAILPSKERDRTAGVSRAMAGDSDLLGYEIYKDPKHRDVWSGLGSGALQVPAEPSLMQREFPLYGRIPPGQDVTPGPYAGLAMILVEF